MTDDDILINIEFMPQMPNYCDVFAVVRAENKQGQHCSVTVMCEKEIKDSSSSYRAITLKQLHSILAQIENKLEIE